jgi:hypothetical protein
VNTRISAMAVYYECPEGKIIAIAKRDAVSMYDPDHMRGLESCPGARHTTGPTTPAAEPGSKLLYTPTSYRTRPVPMAERGGFCAADPVKDGS